MCTGTSMTMARENPSEQPSLRRVLGFGTLMAYGIGDILGAGIYALVGKVAGLAAINLYGIRASSRANLVCLAVELSGLLLVIGGAGLVWLRRWRRPARPRRRPHRRARIGLEWPGEGRPNRYRIGGAREEACSVSLAPRERGLGHGQVESRGGGTARRRARLSEPVSH